MSLHIKLTLFTVLCTLVFSALVSYGFYIYSYEREYDDSIRTLDQLTAAVQRTAAIAAYSGNEVIARDVAEGLLKNDLVYRVVIKTDSLNTALGGDAEEVLSVPIAKDLFSPFDEANVMIGQLAVFPEMAYISQRARRISIENTLLLIAVIAAVACLLSLLVWALVTRPIMDASRQLLKMMPDQGTRLLVPGYLKHSELESLLDAINQLMDKVDEQLNRERRLRGRLERVADNFRMVFEQSGSPVLITDAALNLLNYNPAFETLMHQITEGEAVPQADHWIEWLFNDSDSFRELASKVAAGREVPHGIDIKLYDKRSGRRWVNVQVKESNNDQDAQVFLVFIHDVTRHQEALVASQYEAGHDALTGLLNRRYGGRLIEQLFQDGRQTNVGVELLVIDLDNFKHINDTQGHDAGDAVLIEVAKRLKKQTRSGDVLVRWGGDEFLVAMREMQAKEGEIVARRIQEALARPIATGEGRQANVGVSIGIATCPTDGYELAEVFKKADLAMYQVKQDGRNGVRVYG